ncbi:MAG TPA: hypothetical protein VF826_10225 [Chloroflexia bacterium]
MAVTTFYLHEDDWGMINLLPAENAVWVEEIAQEAQQASWENFAGFAQLGDAQIPTYHNVYVIPEEKFPLSERGIHLNDLRSLLVDKWPEAAKVSSGFSSHTEELSRVFAFGAAHGGEGAFYGNHKAEMVTRLHIRPSYDEPQELEAFGAALAQLGKQYDLMLADWWAKTVVDLRNPERIRSYLAGES